MNLAGKLFVVGTPIGNLSDLSPRAIETLKAVDFIAAEDTRVTSKLLNHFCIKKSMISYFEHNKLEKGKLICDRILSGENCAIVTDAGMPCISDPGEDLVRLCAEYGITVVSIPGPSALITALAVSGLKTGRFTFEGFLSVNKKSRINHLQSLRNETRTMIFYEAPHKLNKTLIDFYNFFGDRQMTIVRELTKIHEEVIRTTTKLACEKFSDTSLKGEIVIILAGMEIIKEDEAYKIEEAVNQAKIYVQNGMKSMEAAKKVSEETNIKKNLIYHELNREKNGIEREAKDDIS